MQEKLEKYFRAKETYYTGNPIMDDVSFDNLENELREAGLLTEDNEQVGYKSLNAKIKHWNPMLSLDKIQVNEESSEEFQKILKKCKEFGEVNIGYKYDGCSVSCQVKLVDSKELGILSGDIIEILTRGDGSQGISIKQKLASHFLTIIRDLIVNNILTDIGEFELRGEAIIKKDLFASKYGDKFANPRNFVAGVLNSDYNGANVDIYNDIDVIVFDTISKDGYYVDMKAEKHSVENIKYVQTIFNDFKKQRDEFQYQVDGLVVKSASMQRRKELGNDKRYPKFAIAIKFPSTIVQTEIIDFEYTVTKQGTINVVALLNPVELDGTIVKRVNCANPQLMIDKGINKGAVVSIKKSGDIIPMITEVIKPSQSKEKCYPDKCPICDMKLDDSNLTHLRCTNENCDGSAYEKFKSGVEIFGLEYAGDSLIKKLYANGMRQGYEIFLVEDIEKYVNEKHKNYLKVQQQINETIEIELEKLIYSLQIENSGRTISKELAKLYSGLEYSEYGLQRSVFQDFKENYIEKLKKIIIKLEEKNIKIKYPLEEKMSKNVIKFEMTGSPKPFYDKKELFVDYLRKNYPNYQHSKISRDSGSDFILFTDDKNGNSSKMQNARKKGIKIMGYDEV